MTRLRTNLQFGTTLNSPLAVGDLTLQSAALASLPVVGGGDELLLTLDPGGRREIVAVTAHGASSSSATITRGQHGTTAQSHPTGTAWEHAAYTSDIIIPCLSTTRPVTGLFVGMRIREIDTGNELEYQGATTGWTRPWGIPWGSVASNQVTANTTAITTGTTVTALTTAYTVITNRLLVFEAWFPYWYSSVAGDTIGMRINEDGATILTDANGVCAVANTANALGWPKTQRLLRPVGARTYSVSAYRLAGTGNLVLGAAAGQPGWFSITDVGPAGPPL